METDGVPLICKNWFRDYVDAFFFLFFLSCMLMSFVSHLSLFLINSPKILWLCLQTVDGVSVARNAETSNGVLTRESERKDKRWYKEYGGPSDRVGKRSDDNGRSSLSLENSEEKRKNSNWSPTNSRQSNELRARSRSRSHDREREMSRSRLVAADEFPVRGRHHDPSRDYLYDRVEAGRTEDSYYRRGRYGEDDRQYGREILERERSKERDMVREGSIRDKDSERSKRRERDSERRTERERESRRMIEVERERLKDYERVRSIDRDRRRERERERRGRSSDWDRRREREEDYVRDRDNERGKSRDRTRYESRERKREKERENDKDRDKGRELKTDNEKYKSVDVGNGERYSFNSPNPCEYFITDDKALLYCVAPNYFAITSRNEDAQNDNDEGVIWKSPEEEEEELNRIKEESRKRMEAILEKYKKKPDQQNELSSQDKGKGNSPSFIAIIIHNDLSMMFQIICSSMDLRTVVGVVNKILHRPAFIWLLRCSS